MNTLDFIHNISWADLPASVQQQAVRLFADTVGVAVAARETELSQIVFGWVTAMFGTVPNGSPLWLDGRLLPAPGAALANGLTIDALDIHDGHRLTKGHAGAAVVPALLTCADGLTGETMLTTLAVGYEIATRAGIALHETACDYHTSGAWNAIAVAAMLARRLGLTPAQTRHALGAAEFYGPRSQMMRVIDHPTMLKDGSGWGAMTGIMAATLAQAGFTGAPAVTVFGDDVADLWADLGENWRTMEQYFKPVAICRWAQPAIVAAQQVVARHGIAHANIAAITVHAFHEATRLWVVEPQDTEQAQYSLPFALAAALVHGNLGARELSGRNLRNPTVLSLAHRITMVEDDAFNAVFPAQRLSRVVVETTGGKRYTSETVAANWDPENPPSDVALKAKFDWLTRPVLGDERAESLRAAVWEAVQLPDAGVVVQLLAPAV